MKWDVVSEMDVSAEFSIVRQFTVVGQDTKSKPLKQGREQANPE